MKKTAIATHYLFVCHGKDCSKEGSKDLKKQLTQELKKRKGHKIKVVKSKCLDRCKFAPSVVCGNHWYGKVRTKDLAEIIQDLEK